ncbi:hypothetical protein D8B22_16505 [Verminephrobacter aporrectodeae subsp. tuberculatae]|nr:hypothetical protein [Verminephrobacter aporrectodeae subsp. tuberculatae]MCW8170667.1 hypothetical protein [Verminephrobacter aporrectodeae subsp. tuberculatae]
MMAAACSGRRRRVMGATALALLGVSAQAQKQEPARALREMQIHRVEQLGLEIWVENQPPWETKSTSQPHPEFTAQSPDNYFPPTVMTYTSWPKERVAQKDLEQVATSAIRRASQNFGLNLGQSRGLSPVAASYGVLQGFEADFAGTGNGQELDVKIFIGHTPGRFLVVLLVYTQRGKLGQLGEVVRRAWGKLKYLGA